MRRTFDPSIDPEPFADLTMILGAVIVPPR